MNKCMSTTPEMQTKINLLDMAYQKMSGVKFRPSGVITGREEAWVRFCAAGFKLKDLETVIHWLHDRIRAGKRDIGAFRFSVLIANTDRFSEELSLAEADMARKRKSTPRETVLAQARPTVAPAQAPDTTKRAGDLIPELLRKMREAAQ